MEPTTGALAAGAAAGLIGHRYPGRQRRLGGAQCDPQHRFPTAGSPGPGSGAGGHDFADIGDGL